MGESSDSVSIDIDLIPLGGKVRKCNNYHNLFIFQVHILLNVTFFLLIVQEYVMKTNKGSVSVFVCGDQEKPCLDYSPIYCSELYDILTITLILLLNPSLRPFALDRNRP